ncbi:hypothetical protein QFX18_05205 [Saccharophagus degradans]|uniref:hypothetical protein n=1 Tax=Saccharophagus degradans TaxID=86304 RepID=UPI00247824E0|nr:hypothetical protein [Saccharophagus degradans]WGO99458.1 hypothetical protein QFX18_05205 [Saccharophagus degradans]
MQVITALCLPKSYGEKAIFLENAEKISRKAHDGQLRKNGMPYITHVEKVVEQLGQDDDAKTVGWLHDVLEDTSITTHDLVAAGIPENLIGEVEILTKKREHTYSQYIENVKKSILAVKVKKADIIANLSDNPSNKQIVKLAKALIQLST